MATTSPDNIWSPDSGDDYALTVDLAATTDSVQIALTTRANYFTGTTAQRTTTEAYATEGSLFWDTDTGLEYRHNGTAWGAAHAPGGIVRHANGTVTLAAGFPIPAGNTFTLPGLATTVVNSSVVTSHATIPTALQFNVAGVYRIDATIRTHGSGGNFLSLFNIINGGSADTMAGLNNTGWGTSGLQPQNIGGYFVMNAGVGDYFQIQGYTDFSSVTDTSLKLTITAG